MRDVLPKMSEHVNVAQRPAPSRVHSRLTLAQLFPWSLELIQLFVELIWIIGGRPGALSSTSGILCKLGRLDKELPGRLVNFGARNCSAGSLMIHVL